MKLRVATLAAVGIILTTASSFAADTKDGHVGGSDVFTPSGDCSTDGMDSWTGPGGAMGDADPAGITLGPVDVADDGTTFDGVILSVDMFHTWIGDLRVSLSYDSDCDGTPDVGPISALCRPGDDLLDCTTPDGCCGCSDDIDGTYLFSDSGPLSMEAACGAGFQAAGCYALDPASANPLAVLDGVAKGGCFTLFAADGAGGDTGAITSWTVYSADGGGGTPVEESTWTELKGTF